MSKLLYTALAVTATLVTGQDYCTIDCGTSGICNVADPNRLQAPWSGSYNSYPQCYDTTAYVCINSLLCPISAPYTCGRQCFTAPPTTCTDTYDYTTVQPGCNGTTTTTTAPTTTAPTTTAPTTTVTPSTGTDNSTVTISNSTSGSTCNLTIPSIAALPTIPTDALRIQLYLSGSNILNDIVCIDNIYNTFVSELQTDLATVLNTSDSSLYSVVTAINSVQGLLTVIDLLANSTTNVTTVTQLLQHRLHLRNVHIDAATTTSVDPATEVIALSQLTNAQIANTYYLKDAQLNTLQVYCGGNNNIVPVAQCASIQPATTVTQPAATTTANTASTLSSDEEYVNSHLSWIIPTIICGTVALLAVVIGLNVYMSIRQERAAAAKQVDPVADAEFVTVDEATVTGQVIHDLSHDNDNEAAIHSIPISNEPQQQVMYDKELLSPSSKRQLILVPENFLYDTKSIHTTADNSSGDVSLYNSDEISEHRVLEDDDMVESNA